MSKARDLIRAAYLLGIQEGAQAAVESVCDDYRFDMPPELRRALLRRRHAIGKTMRLATSVMIETEGMPEELASNPVEKQDT